MKKDISDMQQQLVSVIIPTYNHGKYICDAIESVLQQTYPDIEIIVVDDGSQDDTKDRVSRYGSKINYCYQVNKGLAAARNHGIRKAHGVYIALLDADDIWLPGKTAEQMNVIGKNAQIGMVSCDAYAMNDAGVVIEENTREYYISRTNYSCRKELAKKLILNNFICGGSNALIRRECFDAVGVFNEELKTTEDWDMWLRILGKYDIVFVKKPLTMIRVLNNSMSAINNAEKLLKNELKVLRNFFDTTGIKINYYQRLKSYSFRYARAAWAMLRNNDRRNAFAAILNSAMINPVYFFSKIENIGLFVRILIGNRLVNMIRKPKKI